MAVRRDQARWNTIMLQKARIIDLDVQLETCTRTALGRVRMPVQAHMHTNKKAVELLDIGDQTIRWCDKNLKAKPLLASDALAILFRSRWTFRRISRSSRERAARRSRCGCLRPRRMSTSQRPSVHHRRVELPTTNWRSIYLR